MWSGDNKYGSEDEIHAQMYGNLTECEDNAKYGDNRGYEDNRGYYDCNWENYAKYEINRGMYGENDDGDDSMFEDSDFGMNYSNIDIKQKKYFLKNLDSKNRLRNITALSNLSTVPEFMTPSEFERKVSQRLFKAFGKEEEEGKTKSIFVDLVKDGETGQVDLSDLMPSEFAKEADEYMEGASSESFIFNYKQIALWKLVDMIDNIIAGKCLYEWDSSIISPVNEPNTTNCIIRIILPLLFHAFCHGGKKIANTVACVGSSIANSLSRAVWLENSEINAILIAEQLGFKLISISVGLETDNDIVKTISQRRTLRSNVYRDEGILSEGGLGSIPRNGEMEENCNIENEHYVNDLTKEKKSACIDGQSIKEDLGEVSLSKGNNYGNFHPVSDVETIQPRGNNILLNKFHHQEDQYNSSEIDKDDQNSINIPNDFYSLKKKDKSFSCIEPASLLLTGLIPSLSPEYTTRRILPILARIASSRPIHGEMIEPSIVVKEQIEFSDYDYYDDEDGNEEMTSEVSGIYGTNCSDYSSSAVDSDSYYEREDERGKKNRDFYLGPYERKIDDSEIKENYLHILENPSAKSYESEYLIDDVVEQRHAIGTLATAVALVPSRIATSFIIPLLNKLINNDNSGIRKASINIIPSCSTTLPLYGRLKLAELICKTINSERSDVRDRAIEAIIPFLETLSSEEINNDEIGPKIITDNELDGSLVNEIGSDENVKQLICYMALSVASRKQIMNAKNHIMWDLYFTTPHNDGQLDVYELLRNDEIINDLLTGVPNLEQVKASDICKKLFANSIDKLISLFSSMCEVYTNSNIKNIDLSLLTSPKSVTDTNEGVGECSKYKTEDVVRGLSIYSLIIRLLIIILKTNCNLNTDVYDRIHMFINKLPYPLIGGIYDLMIKQVYDRFKSDTDVDESISSCLFNDYNYAIESILTAIPKVIRLFNVDPKNHPPEKRWMQNSTKFADKVMSYRKEYKREQRLTYDADFCPILEKLRYGSNWRCRYALAKSFILINNIDGDKKPHPLLRIFGVSTSIDSEEECLQSNLLDLVIQLFNDEIYAVRKRAFKSVALVIIDKVRYRCQLSDIEAKTPSLRSSSVKPSENYNFRNDVRYSESNTNNEDNNREAENDNKNASKDTDDESSSDQGFTYTLTVESICFMCYYFIKYDCCQLRDIAIEIITETEINKSTYGCILKILDHVLRIIREEMRLYNHGILKDTGRITEMRNSRVFKKFLLFCNRIGGSSICSQVGNITQSLGI